MDNFSIDLAFHIDPWVEFKEYPSKEWQQEVADGNTRRSYREWVLHKYETAEDEKEVNDVQDENQDRQTGESDD